MDGWETRRKRIPGHDWSIIQLAYPGFIHGIEVNTAYFTGNYTPKVSIQAASLKNLPEGFKQLRKPGNGKAATEEEQQNAALLKSEVISHTSLLKSRIVTKFYADLDNIGSQNTFRSRLCGHVPQLFPSAITRQMDSSTTQHVP